jgi:hypothetical protein
MGFFTWGPAESPTTEQPEREPSTRISTYFAGRGSAPSGSWSSSEWRRAGVESVRISSLIATQGGLVAKHLRKYLNGHSGDDLPWVQEHNGSYYIYEGHHRAAAAAINGRTHIRARVQRTAS